MKKNICLLFILINLTASPFSKNNAFTLSSPDGKTSVTLTLQSVKGGLNPSYSVNCRGKQAILPSALGIDRDDQDFTDDMKLVSVSGVKRIDETYSLKSGKKVEVQNLANEQVFIFRNRKKAFFEIRPQPYNLCYEIPCIVKHHKNLHDETNPPASLHRTV